MKNKTSDSDFDPNLDSVSEVDREPLNGGRRETDWRDARKDRDEKVSQETASPKAKPLLEDGAD